MTETLTFDTFGIVCTVKVTVTKNVDVCLFARYLSVRFGSVALRADTVVARRCILTDCKVSTRFLERRALINIHATFERIASEVRKAGTSEASGCILTNRVLAARIIEAFVDILRRDERENNELKFRSQRIQLFVHKT